MAIQPLKQAAPADAADQRDLHAGLEHHRAGRLDRADRHYRAILSRSPNHPDALHLAGVIAFSRRSFDDAIALIGRALAQQPNFANAHLNLGNVLREVGRLEEAAASYRRAIALMPASALAYSNLGRVLNELGQLEAAVESCKMAVSLDSTIAAPHINMATALTKLRRPNEAESAFLRALMLEPDRAETHRSLALLYADLERYDEALVCHDRAIKLKPDDAASHRARAAVLIVRKDLAAAAEAFRRATVLAPTEAEGWIGLGWALRLLGRFDEADACLARVRALDPGNIEAVRHQVTTGRSESDEAEIVRLSALLSQPDLPQHDRIVAGFALGKLLDNADRYDEAFARYAAANREAHAFNNAAGKRFDAAALRHRVDLLIETYTRDYFADNRGGNPSELPVFIVGMPRSGTSLVEQIAASHSRVFGAGERDDVEKIAFALAGLAERRTVRVDGDPTRASQLSNIHLDRLRRMGNGAVRVTDKMPDNVLQLGLIAVLFPGARVIFCNRDARDIGLSCYFQLFADGLQLFSYDLAECGHRMLEVRRLIHHWRKVLPLRMHEVRYEDLIGDLEGESRRLIDFLGLVWEPACLEFHRTERSVTTMSHWQVRQPLYDRSAGRWRHYRTHLAPLFAALGPGAAQSESVPLFAPARERAE